MPYLKVCLLNASNLLGKTGVEGMGNTSLILPLKPKKKNGSHKEHNEEDIFHHPKEFLVI